MTLDLFQISSLCEIGNIGAGHAAIALAQLVNREIRATIPSVQVVSPCTLIDSALGGSSVIGTHLKVLGEVPGGILFFFTVENALKLVELVVGGGETTTLSDLEESALKETGSILSASYLNALSRLTELRLIPSVPRFLTGSFRSVFHSAFGEQLREADGVVGVESIFIETFAALRAHFFFLPEVAGLRSLLENAMAFAGKEGLRKHEASLFR